MLFDDLFWFRRTTMRAEEADQSMAAQMVFRDAPERPPVDDVDRRPMPGERPHRRAQWDEAQGCWVEWDEVDDEWDVVGEGAATPDDGERT